MTLGKITLGKLAIASLLVAVVVVTATQLPDIQRYIRMKTM